MPKNLKNQIKSKFSISLIIFFIYFLFIYLFFFFCFLIGNRKRLMLLSKSPAQRVVLPSLAIQRFLAMRLSTRRNQNLNVINAIQVPHLQLQVLPILRLRNRKVKKTIFYCFSRNSFGQKVLFFGKIIFFFIGRNLF